MRSMAAIWTGREQILAFIQRLRHILMRKGWTESHRPACDRTSGKDLACDPTLSDTRGGGSKSGDFDIPLLGEVPPCRACMPFMRPQPARTSCL